MHTKQLHIKDLAGVACTLNTTALNRRECDNKPSLKCDNKPSLTLCECENSPSTGEDCLFPDSFRKTTCKQVRTRSRMCAHTTDF